jgi:hypothetical protein
MGLWLDERDAFEQMLDYNLFMFVVFIRDLLQLDFCILVHCCLRSGSRASILSTFLSSCSDGVLCS